MTAFQPYFIPQFRTTTLNKVGGMTDSETSGIVLASIPSDLDITVPGILAFSYANPIDTSTVEYITYTSIDGSNTLQGVTRGAEGYAAKEHANGCTIAWVVSKSHINEVMDALTGVTTGVILSSPKILTAVYDTNGNELFKITATTSAVNELTVANAATGNDPVISSTGGDTDVGIKLTPKGAGKVQVTANDVSIPTGGNIQVNSTDPKRGIYIPSAALTPATTSGCASLAQSESSTNKVNYKTLDFDGTSEEYAWLLAFQAPDWWDLSTITVKFHWTAASGSGDVIWGAAALALSNDDAIDTALGTAQTVTDTLLATGDVHTTSATSALTVGGTPAKGDIIFLRVYRKAADAGDTLAADAKLIGITIKYGKGQEDDQ